MLRFIENIGDYFSPSFFADDFKANVFGRAGYSPEHRKELNSRISPLKEQYYQFKKAFNETRRSAKFQIEATHHFHGRLLSLLDYPGERPEYGQLFHLSPDEVLPVRHILYRGQGQVHLMIMEMQAMIAEAADQVPDGLFQQRYHDDHEPNPPARSQRYHRSQWEKVFTVPEGMRISPTIINKAISQLFQLDNTQNRPKYILLLAGNFVFLFEQENWFRASYLRFDLEMLFSETVRDRELYALFYLLLAKDQLAPQAETVLMEQLGEASHKSAYEVTKDLKEGVIHAVEKLANEAVWYLNQHPQPDQDPFDNAFAEHLKNDCLNYVYRLLFLFYAEAREDELNILPTKDATYLRGYSLEMLRDLEQVPLQSASAQNGYFFHDSLAILFRLLANGYPPGNQENPHTFHIRPLDSPLFQDARLRYLPKVKIRNIVWQEIIVELSLSQKTKQRSRGRISYKNLGINQLGSVYESLLSYRGFFTTEDCIEVHKAKQPEEGTFIVPRRRRDLFKKDEVMFDPYGRELIHPKGIFLYRLSGRDRQQSASYYTPEVLTQATVRYTLRPLLERLENGSMKAADLLRLNILETAMGAAAFHNEVINQLAVAYLNQVQRELNKRIEPDLYREELQKVKAYIATHNVYGVDLNPTAIELGKLSLWLNVIYRDMEPPFFGYRIGCGNAVMGAWWMVYKKAQLVPAKISNIKRSPEKMPWWEAEPTPVRWKQREKTPSLARKEDEIYYFLLGNPAMCATADIKEWGQEYPRQKKAVTDWRKAFTAPLNEEEFRWAQALSRQLDRLLAEHYQVMQQVNATTANRVQVFGMPQNAALPFGDYGQKEKLAEQSKRNTAPYYKLKTVLDYWCALWCWDMRQADQLPSRRQYFEDVAAILDLDLQQAANELPRTEGGQVPKQMAPGGLQGNLWAEPQQLTIRTTRQEDEKNITLQVIADFDDQRARSVLFETGRIGTVRGIAERFRFFHYPLEFVEVFAERGGFDLIVGNPPWVKLEFEEKNIVAERYPEVLVQKTSATQVRNKLEQLLEESPELAALHEAERANAESTTTFLNAAQNYPLLQGQQTNLYKCILENTFRLLNPHGVAGLVHPESIYDDPKGTALRKEVYARQEYIFRFKNQLMLFPDIGHRVEYGIHIYRGKSKAPSFKSISNLFHPRTIESCFIPTERPYSGGIKLLNEDGEFVWNENGHPDRVIHITEPQLRLIAKAFEDSDEWQTAKLVSIQAQSIFPILEKLSRFEGKVRDHIAMVSEGWHETNAQDKGIIRRSTQFPKVEQYELIYSGPHFFVGNPLYKTPRSVCEEKGDYDVIDLMEIGEDFVPRTNYVPAEDLERYASRNAGLRIIGHDPVTNQPIYDRWIDYYKVCFSKMLSIAGERTLQPAIIPPKVAHTNGVISVIFDDEKNAIEFAGLSASIFMDFYIKTVGRGNLYDITIQSFPLGLPESYREAVYSRVLLLNCVTRAYAPLWERHYRLGFREQQWSLSDPRLKPFAELGPEWGWGTPLRNPFERRQALVELDILTAKALGLSLEELILMYEIQFPVLQENESDTWYDANGRIVFTCSKGLTGVGLDRKEWEPIRNYPAGQTYTHTNQSELYHGQTTTYIAPFTRCNRPADYRRGWDLLGG